MIVGKHQLQSLHTSTSLSFPSPSFYPSIDLQICASHNTCEAQTIESCITCTPSFVGQVDPRSIVSIAESLRRRTDITSGTSCTIGSNVGMGAHAVSWVIDFEDGVRWVFRTPRVEYCPILEKRLRSDICGMQLIQSKTNVPIPHIVDFSTSPENIFGRPCIIMEKPQGVRLSDLWSDPQWLSDEKRKAVFMSLASTMLQLKAIEFDEIGSLYLDNGSNTYTVGPTIPSYEEISDGYTTTRATYQTTHRYLLGEIRRQMSLNTDKDRKLFLALMRVFAGFIPDHKFDERPFVLSLPNLDLHSVFVDEEGNVTAITEWDSIFVGPREGGYAKYPSWITLDWDPIVDRYPKEKVSEDGPLDGDKDLSASNSDRADFPPDSAGLDDECLDDQGELAENEEPIDSRQDFTKTVTDSEGLLDQSDSSLIIHTESLVSNADDTVAIRRAREDITEPALSGIIPDPPISIADTLGPGLTSDYPVNVRIPSEFDDGLKEENVDPDRQEPSPASSEKDIPAMLDALRKEYFETFAEIDPASARYTRFSHVFNALERTILASKPGFHILDKFKVFIFGPSSREMAGELLEIPVLLERLSMGKWIHDL